MGKFIGYKGWLLIKQNKEQLVLISKFRKKENGLKQLSKLRKKFLNELFGLVQVHLKWKHSPYTDLHPTYKSKQGDIIPSDSIDWKLSTGWKQIPCGTECCSECCDMFTPKGLDYKCPIWNESCGCVLAILK